MMKFPIYGKIKNVPDHQSETKHSNNHISSIHDLKTENQTSFFRVVMMPSASGGGILGPSFLDHCTW